nr:hypothetical protein [Chloroflexota bacterium]
MGAFSPVAALSPPAVSIRDSPTAVPASAPTPTPVNYPSNVRVPVFFPARGIRFITATGCCL